MTYDCGGLGCGHQPCICDPPASLTEAARSFWAGYREDDPTARQAFLAGAHFGLLWALRYGNATPAQLVALLNLQLD